MLLAWIERRFEAMLERARARLAPDETVRAATWGGCGARGTWPGVLIATDSRVVRYFRFLWKEDLASCPYHAITLFRDNTRFGGRHLELHFVKGAIAFYPCELGRFKERTAAVVDAVAASAPGGQEGPHAGPAPDAAGRIQALHGLLRSGAITQAEYDAKKQELLRQI